MEDESDGVGEITDEESMGEEQMEDESDSGPEITDEESVGEEPMEGESDGVGEITDEESLGEEQMEDESDSGSEITDEEQMEDESDSGPEITVEESVGEEQMEDESDGVGEITDEESLGEEQMEDESDSGPEIADEESVGEEPMEGESDGVGEITYEESLGEEQMEDESDSGSEITDEESVGEEQMVDESDGVEEITDSEFAGKDKDDSESATWSEDTDEVGEEYSTFSDNFQPIVGPLSSSPLPDRVRSPDPIFGRGFPDFECLMGSAPNSMDTLLLAVKYVEDPENFQLANGERCHVPIDEEIKELLFNNSQQLQQKQPQHQVEQVAATGATTETTDTTTETPAIVRPVYTIDGNSSNIFPISGNGSSFVHISSAPVQQCFKVVEQSPPPNRPPPAPRSPPEQQHIISSTTSGMVGNPRRTTVTTPSTFEIIHQPGSSGSNHLVIDESIGSGSNGSMSGDPSRRQRPQMPMVLRQGTREVHNKLEKDRRAHLKECFEHLKKQLPSTNDEKKTSNLNILHSAIRYINTLKKKERDLDTAMDAMEKERNVFKKKSLQLKRDIMAMDSTFDLSSILSEGDAAVTVTSHAIPQPIQVVAEVKNEPSQQLQQQQLQQQQLQQQQLQQQTTTTVVMTGPAASSSASSSVTSNGNGLVSGTPTRVVAKVPQAQLAAITTTTAQVGTLKEVSQPSLQTAFAPVIYHQGPPMVLQKLAIVHQPSAISKNLGDIFLQQQINGKVFPVMNTNYVVKPVVVVSRPNS